MNVYWCLDDLIQLYANMVCNKEIEYREKIRSPELVLQDLKKLWSIKDEQKLVKWKLNLKVGIIQN